MQNRAPRCGHAFLSGLCVVASCTHFDGGAAEAKPAPATPTKPSYRGATIAVRAVLLDTPHLSNADVAALCACSKSLVSAMRSELGLQRRKGAGRPFKQP